MVERDSGFVCVHVCVVRLVRRECLKNQSSV